jgi:integrase
MDYLVYAYLQLGEDDKAKAVVDEMGTVTGFSETFIPGPYAEAVSPARYALERGDWKAAENLAVRPTPLANAQAITYFARALGAARAGDPEAAKPNISKLGELRDKLREAKDAYWSEQVDIQARVASTWTGARAGEALWLNWRDVDLGRAHVTFSKTKNGDARGVPLHPRVIAALANLRHRDGEVFRRPDGSAYERPKHIDDTSAGSRIATGFACACRRAGIKDFHPHDCRHTWATCHYAANRDFGALQRLGGWKSSRMVMRYAHVNVGELAHTIDKLPGGNLGEAIIGKEKSL